MSGTRCESCNGTGDEGIGLIYKRCGNCNGTGQVVKMYTLAEMQAACEQCFFAGHAMGKMGIPEPLEEQRQGLLAVLNKRIKKLGG